MTWPEVMVRTACSLSPRPNLTNERTNEGSPSLTAHAISRFSLKRYTYIYISTVMNNEVEVSLSAAYHSKKLRVRRESPLPPCGPPPLPPYLPTSLPPYLPTSLPPYLPTSLTPYLPDSLPPFPLDACRMSRNSSVTSRSHSRSFCPLGAITPPAIKFSRS